MATWCLTDYTIEGEGKSVESLYKIIKEVDSTSYPTSADGFGSLWLKNIISKMGGETSRIYCRGEIINYEMIDGLLYLQLESAWSEMREWRYFVLRKYPNLKIYYRAEEEDFGYYLTNDKDGIYYPERYRISNSSDDDVYLNRPYDVFQYLMKKYQVKVSSIDEAYDKIEVFNNENKSANLKLVEFAIVDY